MGIGDWGLGPIPNPQSPIPNPQSPIISIIFFRKKYLNIYNLMEYLIIIFKLIKLNNISLRILIYI